MKINRINTMVIGLLLLVLSQSPASAHLWWVCNNEINTVPGACDTSPETGCPGQACEWQEIVPRCLWLDWDRPVALHCVWDSDCGSYSLNATKWCIEDENGGCVCSSE